MEMKKLFSLVLLVSAFAAAPVLAVDGDDNGNGGDQGQQQNQQQDQPAGPSWFDTITAPISFGYHEIGGGCTNVRNLIWPKEGHSRRATFWELKKFWYGVGAAVTASYIYNNLDNIKAAVGLAQDEAEEEAGEAFAAADKCGCENAQEEEQPKEEVCEVKRNSKKANA